MSSLLLLNYSPHYSPHYSKKICYHFKVVANIKTTEKTILGKFLEMNGGYVCDFSNNSFAKFFTETVGLDIYNDKYLRENYTGSKANRLKAFWELESNQIVANLLNEILDYWKSQLTIGIDGYNPFNLVLYDECKKIVKRLESEYQINDANALIPNSPEESFSLLAKSIQESIKKNELEQALDRLHTFVVKYLRVLCAKRSLSCNKDTPVNALMGLYTKYLRDNEIIESEMSIQILGSSIKVLEKFNSVRNNQSLAHDNQILNKEESSLIFSHICSMIQFIKSVENKIEEIEKKEKQKNIKHKFMDDEPTEEEIDAAGDAWIQMQIDIALGK